MKESKNHVKQFKEMENYLCHLHTVTIMELDVKIQTWASKNPVRYAQWENLVRAGERLKELQFFAQDKSDDKIQGNLFA